MNNRLLKMTEERHDAVKNPNEELKELLGSIGGQQSSQEASKGGDPPRPVVRPRYR